jgi:hypothetical protein
VGRPARRGGSPDRRVHGRPYPIPEVATWRRRLRIDTSSDPNVPLTIVNTGGHVMERHRRALVLLPGERLALLLPDEIAGAKAAEHATLVRRVRLEAIARDPRGRPVEARDVLEDRLT